MSDKIKYTRIYTVGDYVAVVNVPMTSTIELTEEALKSFSNEGVVVGLGPDVRNKGVVVGDNVVIASRKYLAIQPESGEYKDKNVWIMSIRDVILTKGPSKTCEVVEDSIMDRLGQ